MKQRSKIVQGGVFVSSLVVSLATGAALGLLHVPFRAEPSAIARFVKLTVPAARSWKAVHLLSTSCPCSQAVSAHLLQRGPLPGLEEYVVLAGNNATLAGNLVRAGFQVQSQSADEITTRFQIPGAPWLVLVSPKQEVVYAGGYSADRTARSGYQDQQIWKQVQTGLHPNALPVYGCALSRNLQRKTDPFGLKYKS